MVTHTHAHTHTHTHAHAHAHAHTHTHTRTHTHREARHNKGTILKASVDYIKKMQRDMHKLKIQEAKQRQLEETNRQMRLRIQVRGEGVRVCGGV